jgi:hypothetical protein
MAVTTLAALSNQSNGQSEFSYPSTTSKGANTCFHARTFGGTPNTGAFVASAAGLAGSARSFTALPFTAGIVPYHPAGGANASYLVGCDRHNSTSHNADMLCDRLWDNSGIVVTTITAQTINSVAWPARDRNATINGDGVQIGLEVVTATTNAAAITNMTISYTNSAGVAGRIGTIFPINGFPPTATPGSFSVFDLQAGDFGVRSVQSISLGTSLLTGAVSLVAFRPLAHFTAGFQVQKRFRRGLLKTWKAPLLQGCFPFWLINQNTTVGGLFSARLVTSEG